MTTMTVRAEDLLCDNSDDATDFILELCNCWSRRERAHILDRLVFEMDYAISTGLLKTFEEIIEEHK